ncbi:MAG TPA: acyltransferase family protein, partial [Lacunisphaera sp.]|nr:acyltransferase family protein [Lacunisphaera sp.]
MARDGWLNRAWLPESRPISPAFSSWLDGLRWIAAALVCSAHVRSALLADYGAPAGHQPWAAAFYWGHGFGHQAVIVFFVLSGFLVGGEVLRGLRQASFDWRVYGIRRFSRLYPVYLAALLLGALWDNLGLHFFNDRLVYNSAASPFPMIFYPVVERLTPGVLEGNLLFLQGVLVPTFGSNSPLWSLANEAWYYFLFPLLLWPFFAAGRPGGRLACFVLFA